MDFIPNLKRDDIGPYLQILEQLRDGKLLDRFDVDISARMGDIQDRVRQISGQVYEIKMNELQSQPGVNRALPMLLMSDEIEKYAKLLDKRFPDPILGYGILFVCGRSSILTCA
jgi:hypothetical protein